MLLIYDTLDKYQTSPTKILINSTNTPLKIDEDFPILTFCNANELSRNKITEANNSGLEIKTEMDMIKVNTSYSLYIV